MISASNPSTHPSVFIILLNWNGYKDTFECLASIQKISYGNYKVVVVDNGSDTNEIDNIVSHFPSIELIKSEKNLGFTGGNNLGIEYSIKENADFMLLLNNDTIVEPNFLEPLLLIFKKNDNTGIAAPYINYYSEPKRIWTSGGKISKVRGSGFAYSDKYEDEIIRDTKIVSFVSGCCMLIKKEIFTAIGLFDAKFFLYVEDTDFCYRVSQRGYKIFVSHDSKIYHKVGKSTSEEFKPLPLYYQIRNRLYFAKKSYNYFYIITILYLLATMFIKGFFWVLRGRFVNIISIFSAFKDFFKDNMGKTDHNKFKLNK